MKLAQSDKRRIIDAIWVLQQYDLRDFYPQQTIQAWKVEEMQDALEQLREDLEKYNNE